MERTIIGGVVLGVVIVAISYFVYSHVHLSVGLKQKAIATVTFICPNDEKINATFFDGSTTPGTADHPPVPGGHVEVFMNDGRKLSLPQTLSADGARYANKDESFVFWNKGNAVMVDEKGQQQYQCVLVSSDSGGLSQVYVAKDQSFSIRYPAGFTANASYDYTALGPNEDIHGVSFTIPKNMTVGTNLSPDSYISIEQKQTSEDCMANIFLGRGDFIIMNEGDQTYSMATSSDAAVGNRYDETVYTIPGSNPCIAIRYFIHYGAIENYPAGAVHMFDRASLITLFDKIRRTMIIGQ